MIFQNIFSASSLFLLASQLAPSSANPVPEQAAAELSRRSFYNGATSGVLEDHWNEMRARAQAQSGHGSSAEGGHVQRDLIPATKTKRDIDFNPSRNWGSGFAGGWGNQTYYHETECDNTPKRRYWYGFLTRAITYPDPSIPGRQRSYWTNTTWWWINDLPANQNQCYLYGAPKYAPGTQCVDKIWNPTGKTWVDRSSSNANSYWTTNNATYKYHKVRTIFDCLLNRTAVEYGDNVAAFGFKPVQYVLDDMKYYRFYDNNNFAWFAACPPTWPGAWKRHVEDIQKRGILEKRCWDCKGINPVWDFFPPQARNPLADKTDIHDYADNIDWPEEFTEQRRFLATYWPPTASRLVEVDGHTCVQAAVSRPGLRHWTVRFFDEAQPGYVQAKDEYEPQETDYL
ncbi:hypothetical protein TWF730_010008 [Orbilia blumenaviensis]|uniref:Uncharacterized protein n=1 Tax=Orbilia blumenaviensis TaxID=1796055 RepID=A0AAV9UUV5_9PEZI